MQSCKIAFHELYTIHANGEVHSGKSDITLQPRQNRNGYLIVTLEGKQLSIHRLVAEHFLPNPYKYPQVNHINGCKQDNRKENLEWVSAEENAQHALETGLRKGFIHVDIKRALLKKVLQGTTVAELASEVGNHPNTLNRMLRVQAIKDGLETEWKLEAKRKRKLTALQNLEVINAKNY